jgi:hypothetical protein
VTAPRTPRTRRPPGVALSLALGLALTALAACSGGSPEQGRERPSASSDPDAAQRERLVQQARGLGIPDGYPGPQNTGVPLGVTLEKSGSVTADEDGQVLENLDIYGCVSIKADDVVIRNVRITCGHKQRAVVIEGSRTGILLEDSEIDGQGSTDVAIGWGGYTLRRVNVHDTHDGPRLGSGVTVEDSWIHDMVRKKGFHSDALQSNGGTGITVRHNTLVPTDTSTGDVLNAAVQLGAENDGGTLADVTIEDNYLDGGNYTVNVRSDAGVDPVVLRDNVFGTSARYGPLIGRDEKLDVDDTNTLRGTATRIPTEEP